MCVTPMRFHMKAFLILVALSCLCVSISGSCFCNEGNGEEPSVEVSVTKVHARIEPDFEIAFPSGSYRQALKETFGKLETKFTVQYDFLENNLGGEIRFRRPIGNFTPGIRFFDGVEFENDLNPRIVGNDVALLPKEKYLYRKMGIELEAGFYVQRPLSFSVSFLLRDIYKGNISESLVIDDGTDLIQRGRIEYNGIDVKEDRRGSNPEGYYFSSLFDLRFRNGFENPVSMDHRNNVLHHRRCSDSLYFTAEGTLYYPIKVWQRTLADFYTVGGYDTLRGVPTGSMGAFRFFLLSTELEYEFPGIGLDIPEIMERDFTLTKLRALFLFDQFLSQDQLSIQSPVKSISSVGAGLVLTITESDKRYYILRLYIAQALKKEYSPHLYFSVSSSRFNLRTSMGLR